MQRITVVRVVHPTKVMIRLSGRRRIRKRAQQDLRLRRRRRLTIRLQCTAAGHACN